ncbi:hypothetical protein GCM10022251_11340 [Phytohabitans flavus]|uniref:Uncharacterized protein n=1 Tax=Phytohabitans flavus TaxID=1076124 RepID=A0A6F8XJU8_9ACTN|nr:hypothetical protein Pflav_004710 [Phytohabitans flavus]
MGSAWAGAGSSDPQAVLAIANAATAAAATIRAILAPFFDIYSSASRTDIVQWRTLTNSARAGRL